MTARDILVAGLFLGGAASAALLPPERPAALPRGFSVSDEQGAAGDLRAMAAGAPALLLPIFTRCAGTCPMTAHFLKESLRKAEQPFRVIVFSFDAEDTANDLREFRERFALPADWRIVRSGDAAATRAFLDRLDFHFMKSSGGFDHPNETFVFSPGGAWAATLAGASFPAADLRTARERALGADDPSAFRAAEAWLIRPEAWILLACAGLVLSLAAIVLARRTGAAAASTRE
ncbi:MAG: SCO family protein [Myxococcales bacterium]